MQKHFPNLRRLLGLQREATNAIAGKIATDIFDFNASFLPGALTGLVAFAITITFLHLLSIGFLPLKGNVPSSVNVEALHAWGQASMNHLLTLPWAITFFTIGGLSNLFTYAIRILAALILGPIVGLFRFFRHAEEGKA